MIRRVLLFLNICTLAAYVLACLACYISPRISWPLTFLGLGFPFILLVVILFLIIWALWRQKAAWINLAILVLSFPFVRSIVTFHPGEYHEKGIKIMSYNVRNFDLYNWSGNKQTRTEIMQLIAHQSPDILCLQEFYTDDEDFHNAEYLRDSLGYKYHYVHVTYDRYFKNTKESRKTFHLIFGLAIFSRYAITDTGVVHFAKEEGNQCEYADLIIKGKTLRVYNSHLQSIHLSYDDYDTIEELSENENTQWYRIRNILKKIKRANAKRAGQAQAVHKSVSQYTGTKIVCGDFNDSPVSYTYQTISSGLNDAFIEKGNGFSKSFSTRVGFFRIDYILPDPGIKVNSYKCIPDELSDHYPIVVTMDL